MLTICSLHLPSYHVSNNNKIVWPRFRTASALIIDVGSNITRSQTSWFRPLTTHRPTWRKKTLCMYMWIDIVSKSCTCAAEIIILLHRKPIVRWGRRNHLLYGISVWTSKLLKHYLWGRWLHIYVCRIKWCRKPGLLGWMIRRKKKNGKKKSTSNPTFMDAKDRERGLW